MLHILHNIDASGRGLIRFKGNWEITVSNTIWKNCHELVRKCISLNGLSCPVRLNLEIVVRYWYCNNNHLPRRREVPQLLDLVVVGVVVLVTDVPVKYKHSYALQLRIEDHFGFRTFWKKFCNIMKYGMNLKFETIAQFFRKIIQLLTVVILESTSEYNRKIISKSGRKMDLYPAM